MEASSDAAPAAFPSTQQEQLRLRKQRREAKIKAGGSARLDRITSLTGRRPDNEQQPQKTPQPQSGDSSGPAMAVPSAVAAAGDHGADDPDEVDISQHYYSPGRSLPTSTSNLRSQMAEMLQVSDPTMRNPPGLSSAGSLSGFPGAAVTTEESTTQGPEVQDPMARLLQQMMDGGGGGDMPPGLTAILGGDQPQSQPQTSNAANLWRILHALFALSLGIYSAATTSFNGSYLSRSQQTTNNASSNIFWTFVTIELLFQSGRFLLERGRLPSSGLLGSLGEMLPEPYRGYIRMFGRYSIIYTTVVSDAMVVLFVLGVVAWWTGRAS